MSSTPLRLTIELSCTQLHEIVSAHLLQRGIQVVSPIDELPNLQVIGDLVGAPAPAPAPMPAPREVPAAATAAQVTLALQGQTLLPAPPRPTPQTAAAQAAAYSPKYVADFKIPDLAAQTQRIGRREFPLSPHFPDSQRIYLANLPTPPRSCVRLNAGDQSVHSVQFNKVPTALVYETERYLAWVSGRNEPKHRLSVEDIRAIDAAVASGATTSRLATQQRRSEQRQQPAQALQLPAQTPQLPAAPVPMPVLVPVPVPVPVPVLQEEEPLDEVDMLAPLSTRLLTLDDLDPDEELLSEIDPDDVYVPDPDDDDFDPAADSDDDIDAA